MQSNNVQQPLLSKIIDMERINDTFPKTKNSRPQCARIVDRGGKFNKRSGSGQYSFGKYNITRKGGNWRTIYWHDFFHTVINTNTNRIMIGIFATYALIIYLFAVGYRTISLHDPECHVGIRTIMEAYIFSLETIMTIGYGAPTDDIFYGGCSSMALLLTLESFAGIFLDAICIGMFFVRFSRATKRANSIVFTSNAIIRKIRGHYYLMFQVCERRRHQLVEAHVRCYAVRHDISADGLQEALFQSYHMRLQQPDDDVGAHLLMALPQIVVHRIDQWSPLFPKCCLPNEYNPSTCPNFPDPSQRAIDHENGNRDYDESAKLPKQPTQAQIEAHLQETELEVVVILEGIDSATSNSMQARYSYTNEDMIWNATFESCVSRTPNNGVLIDFDKFHKVKSVPSDTQTVLSSSVF